MQRRRLLPSLLWIALAVTSATTLGANRARGQGASARRSLIGARCSEEIERFCSAVEPGAGKLARCLRRQDADLSNDCKAALAAGWGRTPRASARQHAESGTVSRSAPTVPPSDDRRAQTRATPPDCAADVERFCKNVNATADRVGFCLGQHAQAITPACRSHFDRAD